MDNPQYRGVSSSAWPNLGISLRCSFRSVPSGCHLVGCCDWHFSQVQKTQSTKVTWRTFLPVGVHQFSHRALCKVSISLSVLRQPAHQIALPAGALPSLNRASCPSAVSSSLWRIERLRIVWHSQCQFAFWRLAKGIEARRTSLQHREFSLQGFSMKTVPSGKAHWPNWLVKLTPTGPACWYPPLRSGAPYLGR
jgi:hypothetical protein